MAFSNEKIRPNSDLYKLLAPIVFDSVRSTSEHIALRNRQCYKCMQTIKKGEKYINHQFRYDKKVKTISFHKDCFNPL